MNSGRKTVFSPSKGRYHKPMATARRNPVHRPKKAAKTAPKFRIHKHMSVAEIVALLPESESVLGEYGLHCFNCSANMSETLEEGYMSHGFAENELDDLIGDLNDMLKNRPERPQRIEITKPAAQALVGISLEEGKMNEGLQVGTDEAGGFCMEFRKTPEEESLVFFHREVPELRLFATPLTLSRIGGSTIDFRDGRFKLDLPEDEVTAKAGCACGGKCSCGH
jgi:hybrid cluster-associated redox disulfide protein